MSAASSARGSKLSMMKRNHLLQTRAVPGHLLLLLKLTKSAQIYRKKPGKWSKASSKFDSIPNLGKLAQNSKSIWKQKIKNGIHSYCWKPKEDSSYQGANV